MSDVISQIVEKQKEKDAEVGSGAGDSELLFVGAKGAGKSTLIHSFLLKEDPQKPTTALEYRFARRSTGTNNASTVCNIWELGGGTQLSELIKVVLLPDRMHACVVAITLDLGAPGEALPTLQFWLEHVRKHVEQCMLQLRATPAGVERANAIARASTEPWLEHQDRELVNPMAVRLVVLAHKWDEFEEQCAAAAQFCRAILPRNFAGQFSLRNSSDAAIRPPHRYGEPENKKVLTRALRYFCHVNGASLLYTKAKDKPTMTTLRNMLYHHVFGTSPVKVPQFDHLRAVVVPAAADNLAAIGKPPVVDGVSVDSPAERWRAAYEAYFPSKGLKAGVADLSMVEAEQFAEEAVDEMRRQKKMELERMRKEMEQEMLLSEGRK